MLRSNKDFCTFLEETGKTTKIGSVDELETYVNAKKALSNGNSAAALQYFKACPNFMDSTAQILSIENSIFSEKYASASALFEEGKYKEAAALFKELDGFENSASLLETCEFMLSVLAVPEATEEEAAAIETEPESTPAEAAEAEASVTEEKVESINPASPVDDIEYISGDYKYKKLNNGKIEISGYTGNTEKRTVPAQIDGFDVYSIGDEAFDNCDNLSQISLPDGLTSIGNYAFSGCDNLSQISLPDGLTSIGNYAFDNCDNLSQISLPDSVSSVGANPFRFCNKLQKITVSKEHPYLAVIDGILYHKADKRLICCPRGLNLSSCTVPVGILSIGDHAFSSCVNLSQISLPDGLTSIGNYAFSYCDNLSQISLPDGLTSIGDNAFSYCDNLSQISLPDGLTSIGNNAFFNCNNLSQISLPDGLASIGNNAFRNCPKLHIMVYTGSYAAQYAKENNLNYDYIDAMDWLNN